MLTRPFAHKKKEKRLRQYEPAMIKLLTECKKKSSRNDAARKGKTRYKSRPHQAIRAKGKRKGFAALNAGSLRARQGEREKKHGKAT